MDLLSRNGWTGLHYSLWRAGLGLWVVVVAALLSIAEGNVATWLLGLLVLSAIPLIIGWWDRTAAAALVVVWVAIVISGDLGLFTACPAVFFLLHALAPAAPFGSVTARGRVDPGGGWRLPPGIYRTAWLILLVVSTVVSFAVTPRMFHLVKYYEMNPDLVLLRIAVVLAGILVFPERLRPIAWLLLAAAWAMLPLVAEWAFAVVLVILPMLLLAADPGWVKPAGTAPAWLFYDGNCGLCHRMVRVALAEDTTQQAFLYAPLGGTAASEQLDEPTRAGLPDSIVVLTPDGRMLIRSAAVLEIARRLGGLWRVLGGVARLVPRPLRDLAYDQVACVRHHLFTRPVEPCPLLPPELRERFDLRWDE